MTRKNKKAIAEFTESGVLEFIADNYIYSTEDEFYLQGLKML